MIGEPRSDVDTAMQFEHTEIRDGFGVSDFELLSSPSNYSVKYTPNAEYLFVVQPEKMPIKAKMDAGMDRYTGEKLGDRTKIKISVLLETAESRIRNSFAMMGWDSKGISLFSELQMTAAEIIGMRMYTGPCCEIYNEVLRSQATGGIVSRGVFKVSSLEYALV